ncbi:hypothetical protein SLA2020_504960 [Shorea laevis]
MWESGIVYHRPVPLSPGKDCKQCFLLPILSARLPAPRHQSEVKNQAAKPVGAVKFLDHTSSFQYSIPLHLAFFTECR